MPRKKQTTYNPQSPLHEREIMLMNERAIQEDNEHNIRYASSGEKMYVFGKTIIPKSSFQPDDSYGYDWNDYKVGPPVESSNFTYSRV